MPSSGSVQVMWRAGTRRAAWGLSVTGLALLLSLLLGPRQAVAQAGRPATLRLYAFDCGRLTRADPQPLLARGVTVTDMSVVAYLIVHPRGTVLWDSCVIPDALFEGGAAAEGRATATRTLSGQLAAIGYRPADVTYLVLSHNHYDHSANANAFAASTWLVQRAEHEWMFPAAPRVEPLPGADRYSGLATSKTVLLDGDHDVFGDGSVVILATPGHTPGHQSLLVNLPKTGPVVLTGDLYHYPAERTIGDLLPPARFSDPAKESASRARIEALLKDRHATLWIGHDLVHDATLRKSPAYYE